MFGSGLNSKGLVKRLLWDKQSPFTIKGMFPGQFEGNNLHYIIQKFFFKYFIISTMSLDG